MAATPEVGVIGLRALNRDIKRLCADAGPLNAALSAAARAAAAPIAAAISAALPRTESKAHAAGTLAADVRILATRSGAKIATGRKSLPYAGPVEFGGWPPGRPFVPGGRYIFPAAAPLAGEAASIYSAGAQRALDSFDWTNTGDAVHD